MRTPYLRLGKYHSDFVLSSLLMSAIAAVWPSLAICVSVFAAANSNCLSSEKSALMLSETEIESIEEQDSEFRSQKGRRNLKPFRVAEITAATGSPWESCNPAQPIG